MKLGALVKENLNRIFKSKFLFIAFAFIAIFFIYQICSSFYISRMQELPLEPKLIHYYPALYIKDWYALAIPVFNIFLVSTFFTDEIENRKINIYLLQGYTRNQYLFSKYIVVHITIIITFIYVMITTYLLGLPLISAYYDSKPFFENLSIGIPLNGMIYKITINILLYQLISYSVILNIAFYFSVLFKKKLIVIMISFFVYLLSVILEFSLPIFNKLLFTYYSHKFYTLVDTEIIDILDVAKLQGIEHAWGIILCISIDLLFIYITWKKINDIELY